MQWIFHSFYNKFTFAGGFAGIVAYLHIREVLKIEIEFFSTYMIIVPPPLQNHKLIVI